MTSRITREDQVRRAISRSIHNRFYRGWYRLNRVDQLSFGDGGRERVDVAALGIGALDGSVQVLYCGSDLIMAAYLCTLCLRPFYLRID